MPLDLRNHTARLLREVESGSAVTITVSGRAVAQMVPLRETRPQFISRSALLADLGQADPGLAVDLAALAGETTDDLDPL